MKPEQTALDAAVGRISHVGGFPLDEVRQLSANQPINDDNGGGGGEGCAGVHYEQTVRGGDNNSGGGGAKSKLLAAGVAPDLAAGAAAASAIRAALRHVVGLDVSVAVARGAVIARLVGPLAKPNSIAVLGDEVNLNAQTLKCKS
jgi:nucleotidyltransferase/DNA polymerase involved in DNA repair